MDGKMGVSGALRIKENERIKKETTLNYAHLERHNGRLNSWMIMKFEPDISNTLMHSVSKVQMDPTVKVGDMGLRSGLICSGRMSENLLA